MAIFGSVETLLAAVLMYASASKSGMLARFRKSIIGWTVSLRLSSSHSVSCGERDPAFLIVGLLDGHCTTPGAYPPEGELGRARRARAASWLFRTGTGMGSAEATARNVAARNGW